MERKKFEQEEGLFKTYNKKFAGYLLIQGIDLISYKDELFIFDDEEKICKLHKKQYERIV